MRVLASADVHGKGTVYEWLLRTASERHVDAMVLAGDLLGCLDGFATPEAAQQHEARLLSRLLSQAACPVFFIMGNDDLVELPADGDRVQSLHGRRVQVGAYSFAGYQYSLPFMGGTFEKAEEGIANDLEELETVVDTNTVFVSHSPALGILDPGLLGTRIGSESLRVFLDRNKVLAHIHGHSHQGFGRYGCHFNVASCGLERAMILDLATMAHEIV